jgi:uncharacterized membrane protein
VTDREAERRNGRRRLSAQVGLAAAVLFVLVMAAGADRPPPPGFVLVIAFGVLLGVVVWRALPLLLDLWDTRGAGPAICRAALAGFLAGLALWALTSVISTGEPSIDVDPAARLIGFTVVGVVGAFGASALTATGRLLDHRRRRH